MANRSFCTFGLRFALACIAALAALTALGCSQPVVGTSSNDKYAVFQEEDESTFVPQPVSIASSKQGTETSIVDSGWWAKDGYIHYGLKVENPNADLIARDVTVQITSYDEDGVQLSQDSEVISFIGPDSIVGFAGECGSGQMPATVEFAVVGTAVWQDANGYEEPLLIASVEEEDKGYYRYEYTGGVTNNTGAYVSTAPICILLEDEDGSILAGYAGSTKRIKEGRTHDYQITINTAPDHAKVEVFAQWSSLNDETNEALGESE
ncbi:FxLYD domain-containing protein [Adlercreutzia equolifaciens]|uniref:FxLYD domain-containing protein n=1 Tax=Adlercreutzia equolifaciens TaxID=446660 RepID=UPI0023AF833A|nr:FxLYD domain-containing protein [Adlercreutzia equolifaciens]MDE8701731.1 FxLYD domain-containing protein [Adlercreutzia equolifaciens]